MADEDFDSLDNLDDLDWSDVEEELNANREQIISAAGGDEPDLGFTSADVAPASGRAPSGDLDINFLLDVQLELLVEVGRTRILIEDLLKLDTHSVVELQSLIGQPLDVRVNDTLVAHGEVVVINEKFGIRITDIVSPQERFASLK